MLIWGIAFSILFISLSTSNLRCFHINAYLCIIFQLNYLAQVQCIYQCMRMLITLYSMRIIINMCVQSVRAHAYEISLQFYIYTYVYTNIYTVRYI
jgi:hypothetical protein